MMQVCKVYFISFYRTKHFNLEITNLSNSLNISGDLSLWQSTSTCYCKVSTKQTKTAYNSKQSHNSSVQLFSSISSRNITQTSIQNSSNHIYDCKNKENSDLQTGQCVYSEQQFQDHQQKQFQSQNDENNQFVSCNICVPQAKTGWAHWSNQDHLQFLDILKFRNRQNHSEISQQLGYIGVFKTPDQVRTHSYRYFSNIAKLLNQKVLNNENLDQFINDNIAIYTLLKRIINIVTRNKNVFLSNVTAQESNEYYTTTNKLMVNIILILKQGYPEYILDQSLEQILVKNIQYCKLFKFFND